MALPYRWAFFSSVQLSMSSDRLESCICRYFEHLGRGGLVQFTQHWICSVTPCLYIPTSTTCKGIKLFGTRIASTMQKLKNFFGMLWNAKYYRGNYTKLSLLQFLIEIITLLKKKKKDADKAVHGEKWMWWWGWLNVIRMTFNIVHIFTCMLRWKSSSNERVWRAKQLIFAVCLQTVCRVKHWILPGYGRVIFIYTYIYIHTTSRSWKRGVLNSCKYSES